jgi:hypothetical protein
MASRDVARAARRVADQQTARLADAPNSKRIEAVIATVTAGAGTDGNSLITVTWRGTTFTASGYNRTYTPVVGHKVICDYLGDGKVFVDYSPIGFA